MLDEVLDGVSGSLRQTFPACAVFGDEKVQQGLEIPGFFVRFGECAVRPLPSGLYEMKQSVEVVYFPESGDDFAEMRRIGPRVLPLLGVLRLPDGSSLRGTGLRFEVQDGLLHAHVRYRIRMRETEMAEHMQTMRQDFVATRPDPDRGAKRKACLNEREEGI